MAESSGTGLLIANTRLDVVAVDRFFLDVFQLQEDDVVGKPVSRSLGGDQRLEVELLAALLFETPVVDYGIRVGSRAFVVSAAPARMEGMEGAGLFVTVSDVTGLHGATH